MAAESACVYIYIWYVSICRESSFHWEDPIKACFQAAFQTNAHRLYQPGRMGSVWFRIHIWPIGLEYTSRWVGTTSDEFMVRRLPCNFAGAKQSHEAFPFATRIGECGYRGYDQ